MKLAVMEDDLGAGMQGGGINVDAAGTIFQPNRKQENAWFESVLIEFISL